MKKEEIKNIYGNVYESWQEMSRAWPQVVNEHMKPFAQEVYSKLSRKKLVDAMICLNGFPPKNIVHELFRELSDLLMTEISAKPISLVFPEKSATYRTLTEAGYQTVRQLYDAKKDRLIEIPHIGMSQMNKLNRWFIKHGITDFL